MGFRYRKSINLGGGTRVNFSKSGVGWSIGGKGFRYTKKATGGTRTTTSIPGSGISFVKDSSNSTSTKESRSSKSDLNQHSNNNNQNNNNNLWFWIIIGIVGLTASFIFAKTSITLGILSLIFTAYLFINSVVFKNKNKIKPHWMLVASILLIVIGSTGYANQHPDTKEEPSSAVSSSHDDTSEREESESRAASISEENAASERAASESKASSLSASESLSNSISVSNSEAESDRIAASQSAVQAAQQAQASQTAQTQANNSTGRAGVATGSHWAIEDGYTWATRKGHSHIIAPGGALPAGYHWEVAH